MLDPKLLRNDCQAVADNLARRGYQFDVPRYQALEGRRSKLQMEVERLRSERNTSAKQVGQARAAGQDVTQLLADASQMGEQLNALEVQLNEVAHQLEQFFLEIPNLLALEVPDGADEASNVVLKEIGVPRDFDFAVKDHVELGEPQASLDAAAAGRMTGSRFTVLRGRLAKLHRVLAQYMLEIHTQEHGYVEVNVPSIVNREALVGTGQLPKFEDDLFHLVGDHGYCLISTSEVPVTNLVRQSIVMGEDLPLKWVCHSPCFRAEAGSYGKDTRGMIRQHQFEKVELVQVVEPSCAREAHAALTNHAETILQRLDLPYRVVLLCAGDTGFHAAKTFDLEVWLPSQSCYREISSCSHCGDFQARRMQARYRTQGEKKPQYLHTLNGSGLAVGRTLLAVMENYQNADGSITIPEVLRTYFDGDNIL